MSESNKVEHLRSILFDVIEGVRNGDVTLEKAKTIAELTQVVVNSAKVEVEFIRATNGAGRASGFLGEQPAELPPAAPAALENGATPDATE